MTNWSEPIESPLEHFPGSVTFKWPFTLADYKRYREFGKRIVGDDERLIILTRLTKDKDMVYYADDWGGVLLFANLTSIASLPPECLTDETGESTPKLLADWLIPLYVDYINEQFSPKGSPPPAG